MEAFTFIIVSVLKAAELYYMYLILYICNIILCTYTILYYHAYITCRSLTVFLSDDHENIEGEYVSVFCCA